MENIGNGLSQRVAEKLGTPGGVAARFKQEAAKPEPKDSDSDDSEATNAGAIQIAKR